MTSLPLRSSGVPQELRHRRRRPDPLDQNEKKKSECVSQRTPTGGIKMKCSYELKHQMTNTMQATMNSTSSTAPPIARVPKKNMISFMRSQSRGITKIPKRQMRKRIATNFRMSPIIYSSFNFVGYWRKISPFTIIFADLITPHLTQFA